MLSTINCYGKLIANITDFIYSILTGDLQLHKAGLSPIPAINVQFRSHLDIYVTDFICMLLTDA